MTTTLAFDLIARDRGASKTFDHVGDSADKSHKRLLAWGKVGAGAVVAGAFLAGKAMLGMAKNAMADEAGQRRLEIALKNTAHATDKQVAANEAWITQQGKLLGVTDDELRPAMQKLVQSTGDIGKAQKLAKIAMDASAGSGKSLEVVTAAMAKANSGNMGALSKLGIRIKDTEGKSLSFTEVTKQMAKTFSGQASSAADTTEGKFKRLQLRWDEAKETLGGKLLPIAGKVADFLLNDFGPAAQKVGDWFREKVLPPLQDFGEKIAPKVRDLMDKVKGAFKDAQPYFEVLGTIFTSVVIPAAKKLAEFVLPVLGKQIEIVGKAFGVLGNFAIGAWNNFLAPVFRFLAKGIAVAADGWAVLFRALGKVPGFGWAKDAADKLEAVARTARKAADAINNIPPRKTVDISVVVKQTYKNVLGGKYDYYGNPTGHAAGTSFVPHDGMYRVGEQGAENVWLPRGARVDNAHQTASGMGTGELVRVLMEILRVLRELPIVRLPDSGHGAYLAGGF